MKLLAACGLVLLSGSIALAQFRGAHSGAVVNGFGTNSGFGSVLFPAGRPTTGQPFTITNPAFPGALGNVVAGRNAFSGVPGFQRGVRRNSFSNFGGGVVYVPFAYPVAAGGYGGYYNGDMPPQQPNVMVIYPPQQQTPVIVNQAAPPEMAHPQIQEYAPSSTGNYPIYQPSSTPPAQQQEADYYLLAFKDHSIYSAVGYWVDGDTLHYITTGNVHNQISVSLVDRDLTEQLNKGRGVEVKLPGSK